MSIDYQRIADEVDLGGAIGYDTITASFTEGDGLARSVTTFMSVQDRDRIVAAILDSDWLRLRDAKKFDEGRHAVIDHAMKRVQADDGPLDGYIDQHAVAIGGGRIPNPYYRDGEPQQEKRRQALHELMSLSDELGEES
ncbi:hypothetical protein [Leifsonia sp. Leaf264]|uniref:hypothetical protein n=1 Tax=Leifsonia sp. Leaf264 TaxID=1736314 RepID=UPI0006F8B3ED|nr:hypothetical protein [Leifsonia sp. Leaf264]KQO98384.1 hypothetical protein ASF30_10005 [Leifsonia sp. Leaf264]